MLLHGHATATPGRPHGGRGLLDQIGSTPLLRLGRVTLGLPPGVEVWAKAEWFNPGGSVKDRAAARMLREAEASGALTHDKTIIDSTSGNTGVAYAMLDLNRGRRDVRAFVAALEDWVIATLAAFNLRGERREDRVGVWVKRPDKAPGLDGTAAEDKIAAIGIRVRRWVSFHGISINVEPDLSHFAGIVPCGIAERHFGVTSLVDLGIPAVMGDLDVALRVAFEGVFGPTVRASA